MPAPFGPDDRQQAARLDRHRHVLQRDALAVPRGDVAQPDVRVGERVGGVERVAVLVVAVACRVRTGRGDGLHVRQSIM